MTGDFKIINQVEPAFSQLPQIVSSGTTASINPGEPTKASVGSVAIMADTDGTTSQRFAGLAKTVSTETTSVAGVVTLYLPSPGLVYAGRAKSAAAADTVAEIQALLNKRVIFDLTGTSWTVDSAAGDSATNGVVIVGGDPNGSYLYFVISPSCSVYE